MVYIGVCGWGYFSPAQYYGENWKKKYKSILQAYASILPCVEVNSTFYRIPRIETVSRWRKEVDELNKNFIFTVKCFQGITHFHKFRGEECFNEFKTMEAICQQLRSKILVFQTARSFTPSKENLANAKKFFNRIKTNLSIVWEVRGNLWKDRLVKDLFEELGIIHCVDPFTEREPQNLGKEKIVYLRLHGCPPGDRMYNYKYTEDDLEKLATKLKKWKKEAGEVYIMFNNYSMYEDALAFRERI